MAGGRPTKYKAEYVEQVKKLCELGATDMQIADFFQVDLATINRWKLKHPEFCASLKLGKEIPDSLVVRSLFQRAMGYSHEEDDIRVIEGQVVITPTIKHYPPDSTSLIFWLKNRNKEDWRDKQEIGVDGKLTHEHEFLESLKPTTGIPSERDS